MDFSVIDEMFDIYKNEDRVTAEEFFINCRKNYEKYGKDYLVGLIKSYIKQEANNLPNYFVSNKDDVLADYNLVKDIVTAFENLIMSVDFLITDRLSEDYDSYDQDNYKYYRKDIKPHDLFNINIDFIEQAVIKYGECYIDDFKKIKDLIIYVKKNKILKKIYKDDSWKEIDFEELIYSLYDYIKDKSVFKSDIQPSYNMEFFLFEKIKANCAKMLKESFDKFRPSLNSTKQIRADFGKLIFSRNLIMFYQTGIMPSYEGFIDFSVDFLEHLNLIEDFDKLYNEDFDEISFREKQGNFICNPEVYSNNYKLEADKIVKQGDKLIAGFIISCSGDMGNVKNDYLIHIEIDDVNNLSSNYEMQINIVPHGNLEHRLQLIRLDNWESKQSHKNIAKTLTTKTHVHIYNEFDMLRGRTNGSFDIAYNLEGEGVDFKTSLKMFLNILDLGTDISKTIQNSIIKDLYASVKFDIEV